MKTKVRRIYVGQAVVKHISEEMGQPFGRARLTPSEAATRRQLSRWHASQRVVANQAVAAAASRLVTFSRKRLQQREIGASLRRSDFQGF